MKDADYIIVMITCPSKREALKLKRVLLEQRKAACVNIIPGVSSFFLWKGKVDSSPEVLMLAKTKRDYFEEVVSLVKKSHRYEVPEIIALSIIGGNEEYLKWIDQSLGCKTLKGKR